MAFTDTFSNTWGDLRALTSKQRNAVLASYLGWTLDAFDFFLMVFVIKDVAHSFGAGKTDIAWATTCFWAGVQPFNASSAMRTGP